MDPERWADIEGLLAAALELGPAERAAFLDEACRDDPSLRQEIEELLRAHESDPSFLEEPIADLQNLASESLTEVERLIGPYRILRRIGRGGMGDVFLAVHEAPDFRQEVALKIMRRGLDTDDLIKRFHVERQILAQLSHPNIAGLRDAGATDDGRPFFVMEHVEGVPITPYCDEHRLAVSDRLRLFLHVCGAVHHAHRSLVIHRDLKPSNILVTADGTPKLLDFGIAKLLDPTLAQGTLPVTGMAFRLMTPSYASPEQVRGEPVTTASDVYSLGVVLYELLAGHLPYRLGGASDTEIERVVCETAISKPSTAVIRAETVTHGDGSTEVIEPESVSANRSTSAVRLSRKLEGDIDNIVLMALRRDPARRYGSVDRLADDIDRHLRGLPVAARPATVGYRAHKFIRRHRLGVASVATVVALLAGLAAVYVVQSAEARRERDRAEGALGFVAGLFETAATTDASEGQIIPSDILDLGAQRVETEFADQPELRAALSAVLSQVYRSAGADDLAEQYARQTVRLGRELYGSVHPAVAAGLEQIGTLLRERGNYPGADTALREAVEIRRELVGEAHPDYAASLMGLGRLLAETARHDSAEMMYGRALRIRRDRLGPDAPQVASTLEQMAVLDARRSRYESADTLFRASLDIQERLYGLGHPDVVRTLKSLGWLYHHVGDYAKAEQTYRRLLASQRERLGDVHPEVGILESALASVLEEMGGREDEAMELFAHASGISPRRLPGYERPGVGIATIENEPAVRDVRVGAFESNTSISVVPERRGVTLQNDLAVDIAAPGRYATVVSMSGAVIPRGTTVNSYLLHLDHRGDFGRIALPGSITFDEPVIGLILTSDLLDASDAELGTETVDYPTGERMRGVELDSDDDMVELKLDERTLSVVLAVGTVMDQLRVLTLATPDR